ncbi:MAG: RecQ family zinc-binding domain-containing protein, partial [Alistipes sp.]
LQQNGYMTLTDAQENPARIMFCVSRDDLYKLRVQRDELDHFIRTLLRLYNGVFTEFRQIDEGEIATWSGYTVQRVKELLKRLWQLRVIRYVPSNRSPILFMDEERLPRADLYIAPETYKRRQELMRERFEHMLAYAANETRCRSAVLEGYFGEAPLRHAAYATSACTPAGKRRQGLRHAVGRGGLRKNCGKGYPAGQPTRTNWPRIPRGGTAIGGAARIARRRHAGTGRDGKIGLK